MKDNYAKTLELDYAEHSDYFSKSLQKTMQQKFLENLLKNDEGFFHAKQIADICAGGGHLVFI